MLNNTFNTQAETVHLPRLLRSLKGSEQKKIINSLEKTTFKEGDTIVKNGTALTHIIFFTKGSAKLYLENENQKYFLLKILKPFQLIGGPGFLTDNRQYFSLIALEEVEVNYISTQLFKELLLSNPEFCLTMISYLNRVHTNLYNKIAVLTNNHMIGRVADTLLYLADGVYNSNEFTTKLSRLDLANMSNMTRESLIRTIKDLKDNKIIDCENDHFRINDRDKLIRLRNNG